MVEKSVRMRENDWECENRGIECERGQTLREVTLFKREWKSAKRARHETSEN